MRAFIRVLVLPVRIVRWLLVLLALIPAALFGLVLLAIIVYAMTGG